MTHDFFISNKSPNQGVRDVAPLMAIEADREVKYIQFIK